MMWARALLAELAGAQNATTPTTTPEPSTTPPPAHTGLCARSEDHPIFCSYTGATGGCTSARVTEAHKKAATCVANRKAATPPAPGEPPAPGKSTTSWKREREKFCKYLKETSAACFDKCACEGYVGSGNAAAGRTCEPETWTQAQREVLANEASCHDWNDNGCIDLFGEYPCGTGEKSCADLDFAAGTTPICTKERGGSTACCCDGDESCTDGDALWCCPALRELEEEDTLSEIGRDGLEGVPIVGFIMICGCGCCAAGVCFWRRQQQALLHRQAAAASMQAGGTQIDPYTGMPVQMVTMRGGLPTAPVAVPVAVPAAVPNNAPPPPPFNTHAPTATGGGVG
jgi:hypothetical protein